MSSLSTVSGSSTDLVRLFQQYAQKMLSNTTGSDSTDATDGSSQAGAKVSGMSPPPGPPPMDSSRQADFVSKIMDAAQESGLDTSSVSLSDIEDEINTAITNATQNADGSTDSHQAVQQAIDDVLSKHGVDLDTFKDNLRSTMGPPPGGNPPQGTQSNAGGLATNLYSQQTTDAATQLLASFLSTLDVTA